jgi:hypothetical protein
MAGSHRVFPDMCAHAQQVISDRVLAGALKRNGRSGVGDDIRLVWDVIWGGSLVELLNSASGLM